MTFIQRNNVVQQVSSAASHPPLRDPILPWTPEGSSLGNVLVVCTAAITSNPNF